MYQAWATDGKLTVYNCYGSTKEAAKEMALFRFHQVQDEKDSGHVPRQGMKPNERKELLAFLRDYTK
jgi:hypothetical protein